MSMTLEDIAYERWLEAQSLNRAQQFDVYSLDPDELVDALEELQAKYKMLQRMTY